MRIDQFIAKNYGFSRNKVQYLIDSGLVFVDEKKIQKASTEVQESVKITIIPDNRVHWVSRSAQKLF